MQRTKEQISQLLNQPKIKGITKAINHDERIAFHSINSLSSRGKADFIFLDWVKSILPKDKFKIFATLFKKPIDTIELTSEIYQALSKVFQSQDATIEYYFTDENYLSDFDSFNTYGIEFWQNYGLSKMKSNISSIMVVDLPQEQKGERPEPYLHFVSLNDVLNVDIDDCGNITWLIVKKSEDVYCYYDEYSYKLFEVKDGELLNEISDSPHDLGYCPASFFWSEKLEDSEPFVKKSPISDYLTKLDWLLFFSISKRFSDLYSPYTIYWGYTQDCDYQTDETYCDSGFLMDRDGRYLYRENELYQCPKCSNKIAGVGTYIDVPPPNDDTPAMAPPVGKIDVDVNSLNYNVEEVNRIAESIYQGVTGNSLESINDKAVNEKQIASLFEARKQVLLSLKKNFEIAQKWVTDTVCNLRYGSYYLGCHVDYGQEFYLFNSSELLNMYLDAKESKADTIVLDMLHNKYINTSFKGNPNKRAKANIIANIDPLRHMSNEDAKGLYSSGIISYEDYYTKINLSTLVMKFERERGNIGTFLIDEPFSDRIEIIKEIINGYIVKPELINQNNLQNELSS